MKISKDRKLLLVLVGVIGVFFYQVVLFGRIPAPVDALVGLYHPWRDAFAGQFPRGIPYKNYLITDPFRQQIPWRKLVIDEWKKGSIPSWNPNSFGGTSLRSNIQAAVFYPTNILFAVLPFVTAWTMTIMLQLILAGVFMYLFLRHQDIAPVASLSGTLAWVFSGFHVAWLTWGTIVQVSLWIPLLLMSAEMIVEQFLKSGKAHKSWSIVFVFALCSSVFAGHIQITLYSWLLLVGFILWRLKRIPTSDRRTGFRIGMMFALLLVISIAVTSVQWMPLINGLLNSSRIGDISAWKEAGWFIPWQHLIQFFVPDFFGNPSTLNYWGVWNYGELVGYVGIAPVFFAISALLFYRGNSSVRFWAWVCFLSLLFALPSALSQIPFAAKVPVISSLQPTRLMVLIDFSLAMLAAIGIDGWMKKSPRRIFLVFACGGVLLLILWILSWSVLSPLGENISVSRRNLVFPTVLLLSAAVVVGIRGTKNGRFGRFIQPSSLAFILFGVIALDLLRFGWKFTPFVDRKYFFPDTAVTRFLKNQKGLFRIMTTDDKIFPPNTASYYGLESIDGYDPIYDTRFSELIAASERNKPDITPPLGFKRIIAPHRWDSPLIQALNVRFILSLTDIQSRRVVKVFKEGETRVYELKDAAPRAYFARHVYFEKDGQKALERMFDASFSPMTDAVVEYPISVLPVAVTLGETVRVTDYSASGLGLSVYARSPRLLVLSNVFDSGWRAYVDGSPSPIYRTNFALQSVVIPGGKHRVEFTYR